MLYYCATTAAGMKDVKSRKQQDQVGHLALHDVLRGDLDLLLQVLDVDPGSNPAQVVERQNSGIHDSETVLNVGMKPNENRKEIN